MQKKIYLIFCLFFPFMLVAQQDSVDFTNLNIDFEQMLEFIAENEDEQGDYSELIEDLQYLQKNKININQPDYDILEKTLKLSDIQIYNLQAYLHKYGQIYSIYELSVIDGFDKQTIERILPYVSVENISKVPKKITVKELFRRNHQTILMRYGQVLEKQQGYSKISKEDLQKSPNSRYLGSPQALLLKYKFSSSNKLQFGFTAEKDAGEPFFSKQNKYGFDFYSAHLKIMQLSIFKTIAIGDYQLNFGQGLCLNMGFSMSNSVNYINACRQGFGLKSYSSANENNYLRGIATTIDCKILDLTLFYSYKKLDAALSDDSSETASVAALHETGYHRTQNEMEKKNAIQQHILGGHIDYKMRIARLGLTTYYTRFQVPLNRILKPYNQFSFNDIDNLNMSIDYKILLKKAVFFGEVAMSKNKAMACINGVDVQVAPRFLLAISYRYYSREYQCLYSGAMGESSDNANENGVYIATQMIIGKFWQWNTCLNYSRFQWLKYKIDAPSAGFELQTQLNFSPSTRFNAYFRWKIKNKETNLAQDFYNVLSLEKKQAYRLHINWKPITNLTLKTRIEFVRVLTTGNLDFKNGYLFYQDIKYQIQTFPISFSCRFAIFDTYSYNERIYAMEDDVLYAYNVPSLSGKGSRMYLMTKIDIGKHIDFYLKISQTYYRNKSENGSGLTKIEKPTKTHLQTQLILHL